MEVHNALGPGFPEVLYQRALQLEFASRGIPAVREQALAVDYKGIRLGAFRADFVCFGDVVVELKARDELRALDCVQVLQYLKASGRHVGRAIAFGGTRLDFACIAHSKPTAEPSAASA